jgi:hypothetical protein
MSDFPPQPDSDSPLTTFLINRELTRLGLCAVVTYEKCPSDPLSDTLLIALSNGHNKETNFVNTATYSIYPREQGTHFTTNRSSGPLMIIIGEKIITAISITSPEDFLERGRALLELFQNEHSSHILLFGNHPQVEDGTAFSEKLLGMLDGASFTNLFSSEPGSTMVAVEISDSDSQVQKIGITNYFTPNKKI